MLWWADKKPFYTCFPEFWHEKCPVPVRNRSMNQKLACTSHISYTCYMSACAYNTFSNKLLSGHAMPLQTIRTTTGYIKQLSKKQKQTNIFHKQWWSQDITSTVPNQKKNLCPFLTGHSWPAELLLHPSLVGGWQPANGYGFTDSMCFFWTSVFPSAFGPHLKCNTVLKMLISWLSMFLTSYTLARSNTSFGARQVL